MRSIILPALLLTAALWAMHTSSVSGLGQPDELVERHPDITMAGSTEGY